MYRKIHISALVLVAFHLLPLAQSIGTIAVYLNSINYISSKLCVNRDVPEMHCEGTCVLAQMMTNENANSPNPFDSSENSIQPIEVLGFLFYDDELSATMFSGSKNYNQARASSYNYTLDSNLERPPDCVV